MRARDDGPRRAVELLDERPQEVARCSALPDREGMRCVRRRGGGQCIIDVSRVGAWHLGPRRAVPLFDQGPIDVVRCKHHADRPCQ